MSDAVTLVTQYYPPERGAAQVRLACVVGELRARGYETSVITALPNYPTGEIFPGWRRRPMQVSNEEGSRVARVWLWAAMGSGIGRLANYLSFAVMSILPLVRLRPPDWYLVEYPTLFGALPAVCWARLRRRRVVVIVADLWVDSIAEVGAFGDGVGLRALRAVERWMFRQCTAVTAVTEGVRSRLIANGVDAERIVFLPNGADTQMFAPGDPDPAALQPYGIPAGNALFLYAGTHGYVHGLDVLLDAAAELRDEPISFLLVGGGSEKSALVARAADMGLTNVVFADPVSPETVAALLRHAVAGLAAVRGGDLYRTVRSAKALPTMAAGRPVIYSGDDEGSRLVAAAGAGLVTPAEDALALAAAVRRLAADRSEADELGRSGRRWIVEHASWSHLVGEWLAQLAAVGASA